MLEGWKNLATTTDRFELSAEFPQDENGWRTRKSWTVAAEKKVQYDVLLLDGLFNVENRVLLDVGVPPHSGRIRRFVVIDAAVDRLYGERIRQYLVHHEVAHHVLALDLSEQSKTMDVAFALSRGLDEFGIDRRREPIIGIGGGVLLDVVGLTASLYRRGTPYVRVPTTLIGLVDASVGAKTGVNHDQKKNRLGSYFPPLAALLDRGFLATLEERHIVNGLAEILKIALVKDRRLFEILESHSRLLIDERFQGYTELGDQVALEVLDRATTGMLEELEPNLWEHTLERLVDYGHSISPTIEMLALPELLHGEAVAIDMALFTVLSCRRGLVNRQERNRILRVMCGLQLPIIHSLLEPDVLARALADTVRHRDGQQRLPMPVGIGSACFVNDVTESELILAAKELRELEVEDA